jgi:hypothetical protein
VKTTKSEIEDWLTLIDLYLQRAAAAFASENYEQAEADVSAARQRIGSARLIAERISN